MCYKKNTQVNDYKNCLLNNEMILKSQQRFESDVHNVFTEKIHKIALTSNDDKRLHTFENYAKQRC